MSLSAARRRDGQREIDEIQRQIDAEKKLELDQKLAPELQKQARLLAQLHEAEQREVRKQLSLERSLDFNAPIYEPDGSSPAQIAQSIRAAVEAFRQGDGANLSDKDFALLQNFLRINTQKDFDLSNVETWKLAHEFIQSKLNPSRVGEKPTAKSEVPINPRIPSGLIAEPVEAEMNTEVEPVNPHHPGTRAYDAWDRQQAKREFVRQSSPVWTEVLQEFVNRGFFTTDSEQAMLYQAVINKNVTFTADVIRRTAVALCPDAGTETEQRGIEMSRTADTTPMDEWKKHWGVNVRDYRGGHGAIFATHNVTR